MLTEIRDPDSCFSPFYENNSLLIQFILEEFIESYQLVFQIKTLIQKRLNFNQTLDSLSSSLIHLLSQLIGSPPKHERYSFSRWTKGPLTKFKEYAEQFSRNSRHQNRMHIHLHISTRQAWVKAIHNLELLDYLYVNPCPPNPKAVLFLIPLKHALKTLQVCFNQISRYIPRIVNAYWDDENILLFLLRKKALLAKIYGNDFLYQEFKWPIKGSELIQLLTERYQTRGFEALLPVIQELSQEEGGGSEFH